VALSDAERKALASAVASCRELLEKETKLQLERVYGFSREGVASDLAALEHRHRDVGERLREWHRHLQTLVSGMPAERANQALARMAEECAFTFLHRLAALRMAEERGVVRSCVRDGVRSDGFKLFAQYASGGLGSDREAYPVFLERMFDEVAEDRPALFDRREPRSLVVPDATCVESVVAKLNSEKLARVWTDDEAIGWVYQDFHTASERKGMRGGKSSAPKDAKQLAVRNQIFTPRWIVELLADNSLGRLWSEMTRGKSQITERCVYLVPVDGLEPPAAKDPRDIRVLDPACGSGHFLLYAFDLLEHIYLEAWREHVGTSPERTPLWEEYRDEARLRRELPELILRHSLFGVDIDERCIQIAEVALWLRAHRSLASIPASERRPTRKMQMNLVCAEPMPGDRAQIDAFAATLQPSVLGDLVREVWELLRPVGEMGLLLRVDDALRTIVARARERGNGALEADQGILFRDGGPDTGRWQFLRALARDASSEFWSRAEQRVQEALGRYAEDASERDHLRRRLFADDAERGLALIDLSRLRYDVVLMNPPFGQPAERTKNALDHAYAACGHEIYAMFFQRALELLEPHGQVGAITERDWLGQASLRGFRERVLGKLGCVVVGVDLGYGVLEAKVETTAVVIDRRADLDTVAHWIRVVTSGRKEAAVGAAVECIRSGRPHVYAHRAAAGRLSQLRGGAYAYWFSEALLARYARLPSVEHAVGDVKQGTATAADFRFLRLAWEVDPATIALGAKWPRFAKGGEHRPFWDDVYLTMNWENAGKELDANPKAYIRNPGRYGEPGVTWPRRTNLPIGPRVLPAGCAFGDKGPSLFSHGLEPRVAIAVLASRPFQLLLGPWLNTADASPKGISRSYEVGLIKAAAWPSLPETEADALAQRSSRAIALARELQLLEDITAETCAAFVAPRAFLSPGTEHVPQLARRSIEHREDCFNELAEIHAQIDEVVVRAYGLTRADLALMDHELGPSVGCFADSGDDPPADLMRSAYLERCALPGERLPGGLEAELDVRVEHRRGRQRQGLRDEETLCRLFEIPPRRLSAIRRRLDLVRDEDTRRVAADIASWAVGTAFGRWDVRLVARPELHPSWPDPFGPLPRCPLGQLVDARGLPATHDRIASDAWLAARTDATRLPDVEEDEAGALWLVETAGARTGPAESDASSYPVDVAWEGLLQDDALEDDPLELGSARHPDDLSERVRRVLEWRYGEHGLAREAEIVAALGAKSLLGWLRSTNGFFGDHLKRYSKSKRTAPIYWPLSTESGGFTLWLYYPRFGVAMLNACVNRLRESELALSREETRLLRAPAGRAPDRSESTRLDHIESERRERAKLREALADLIHGGFTPHLDDGAIVNAAPLARWFRHREWREDAAKLYRAVERREHDWSHLALWLRRDKVLARCRKERDLAIAHGREDLYQPDPKPSRSRARRKKATQLDLTAWARDRDE
jgi:hypothetical protein